MIRKAPTTDDPTPSAPPDGTGHRQRLRERLLADPDGLLDHELLEYLLAVARPRIDTKPVAKELIRRFGSLGAVFAAEPDALARTSGVGEQSVAAIRIVRASALRMLRGAVMERPVLSNWQALIDYLRADMAFDTTERFRVLHLNSRNMLIRDEVMSRGTVDESAVHVREVIRRAMDLGSASIILVHNHPSGDVAASRADIDVTRAVADAAKRLGITVHDHLIVGGGTYRSLRSEGLI